MKNKDIAVPPQQRIRDKSGRFLKGQTGCGNSPGRPKLRDEFKQFAQEKSLEALKVVYSIMADAWGSQKDRVAAARLLMEYGYGRPSAEYDKERLEIDRKMADARIAQIEREESEGPQQVEVIISGPAKELGM